MFLPPAIQPFVDQIRAAAADSTPLHIRGGGSKDFYGCLQPAGLVDTRSLHGVVDYAPSELVVTVGAGTPLVALESLLAEHGQCLPFEPPHFRWSSGHTDNAASPATVGGLVASGLAGPARASAGSVRDYVLGVKLINGRGEYLSFGGQVMKNVAGYDVSRLMAGAMGTLGLITEVSLKVLPHAPAEATLVFPLAQEAALEQLHRWAGEPLPLNASCWVHDNSAGAAGRDLLFVRLRGAVAAVEAACHRMLAEARGERMDTAQAHVDWARCRDHTLPFFTEGAASGHALWRLSVPQTAPVLDLAWPQLIEWHGGLRWLWAPLQAGPQLRAAAATVGGNATVFVANKAYVAGAKCQFGHEDAGQAALRKRLKAAFDPAGIFNPGRLYSEF
jgi:glycolate oxidase FAD binding subunit